MNYDYDLIVFDREYEYAKKEIKEYGEALTQMIDGYTLRVKAVMNYAVKDELITDALQRLLDQVIPLKEIIQSDTDSIGGRCSSFVRDIDAADDFLY